MYLDATQLHRVTRLRRTRIFMFFSRNHIIGFVLFFDAPANAVPTQR